jgi:hypothetical protein
MPKGIAGEITRRDLPAGSPGGISRRDLIE